MFMNADQRNSLVHNAVPTVFNFPEISAITGKCSVPSGRKKFRNAEEQNLACELQSLCAAELEPVTASEHYCL